MFAKDVNELLNEILVSYQNLSPIIQFDVIRFKTDYPDLYDKYLVQSKVDVSVGSINYMNAAALASMLYGIYKMGDRIVDQSFSDTAEREFMERQAAELGVLFSTLSDTELANVLSDIKKIKLMGGNKYDFSDWSKDVQLDIVKNNPSVDMITNSGFDSFNASALIDESISSGAWNAYASVVGSNIIINASTQKMGYSKARIYCTGLSDELYSISFSSDGFQWTSAAQLQCSVNGWNEVSWLFSGVYQYWKIELSSAASGLSVVTEIELYDGPEKVSDAVVYPLAQGEGTFDVVIQSNLNDGIPSISLQSAVLSLLTDRRPVCSGFDWGLRVCVPTIITQNILIVGVGSSFNASQAAVDITAYINQLKHGEALYLDQLRAICVQNGASYATISTPSSDVHPLVDNFTGYYEMIRPGLVSVS